MWSIRAIFFLTLGLITVSPFLIQKSRKSLCLYDLKGNQAELILQPFENPPYFPTSVNQLADDTVYSIKVGLMRKLSRILVVANTKVLDDLDFMLAWLMKIALQLVEIEESQVRIFVDPKYTQDKCQQILKSLNVGVDTDPKRSARMRKIKISPMNSPGLVEDKDSIVIVFNPSNNGYLSYDQSADVLDNIQGICFNAGIRSIPIIMINPDIMAYPLQHEGQPFRPLILNDFRRVYQLHDNIVTLRDQKSSEWFGFVFRLSESFDLFFMVKRARQNGDDMRYYRIRSESGGVHMNDISDIIDSFVKQDAAFLNRLTELS